MDFFSNKNEEKHIFMCFVNKTTSQVSLQEVAHDGMKTEPLVVFLYTTYY